MSIPFIQLPNTVMKFPERLWTPGQRRQKYKGKRGRHVPAFWWHLCCGLAQQEMPIFLQEPLFVLFLAEPLLFTGKQPITIGRCRGVSKQDGARISMPLVQRLHWLTTSHVRFPYFTHRHPSILILYSEHSIPQPKPPLSKRKTWTWFSLP